MVAFDHNDSDWGGGIGEQRGEGYFLSCWMFFDLCELLALRVIFKPVTLSPILCY